MVSLQGYAEVRLGGRHGREERRDRGRKAVTNAAVRFGWLNAGRNRNISKWRIQEAFSVPKIGLANTYKVVQPGLLFSASACLSSHS